MILCNKFTSLASKGDESRLLPKLEDCGKQSPSPKIAGGAVAELDDFAWLALLYYKNKVRIQHGCHGSLISNKYVVTAAHCLDSYQTRNIGNLHSVVLGEYDTTTPKDCKFLEYGGGCADPIQEFFIEHFQIHPNYEIEGARSDIALIRLRGTAKFTGAVSTVKLKARIFPLPNAICYSYLSLRLDSTEMCAGSSDGTDTCVGDSGGPLMVTRVYNKEYKTFLIGVVSIGGTCGSGAAIYTNVALFTEWIRDNVKELYTIYPMSSSCQVNRNKSLRSKKCGDSETKDMILCNKVEQLSNKTSRKIKLLPRLENCGLQMPIPKIYGGKIAELDDFTWIALLKYKNRTGHIQYGCHGSLVSNKYVVTAAHCLKTASQTKLGNLHSVVLGEYDIRTDVDCVHEQYGGDCNDPVQEFSIDSVRIHEDFESKGAMSDIALIRLNGSATFTNFVKPICLPLKLTPLQKHEPLWIAGWGKIENSQSNEYVKYQFKRTMSNVKLKAQIYSLSKEDCERNMNYSPDDTQLCAGSDNGADTCRGDSGGPLMVQRALKNEYKTFLVGVVSFGTRCGTRSAIYTKMSKFTDWILDNLES
ncbi:Trypsin domain containing protein [Asbolus verrucosus]|uniref:Trypsin domain containing protein n=1 Tax=Asbolus verrucosus TaxID=1661398 RepID=A0A482VF00_ASBVE|nr:Trypsin domain containing protein [Asbolus verrucosus]